MTGMLGTTCSHSIPVCGGFVDMLGPEQFAYYLLTLKSLILQVRVMTVKQHGVKCAEYFSLMFTPDVLAGHTHSRCVCGLCLPSVQDNATLCFAAASPSAS